MASPRWRFAQFNLRALFIMVTLACLLLAGSVRQVQRRLRAVDAVLTAEGSVAYPGATMSEHLWLAVKRVPVHVWLRHSPDSSLAGRLTDIGEIKCLAIAGAVRDLDLLGLEELTDVSEIQFLKADRLSDAALARLKRKLPNAELWITTPDRHVRWKPGAAEKFN